jgi:NADH-quinone oxidoreductase subunit J
MTAPTLIFLSLAVLSIATAAGMLLSRNAVYAALFLILNFSTVALLYLLLGAPFIAMAQVTVYAGAIMVLFLFVIMLLGAEKLPESKNLPWQRPVAIVVGVILLAEGVYLLIARNWSQIDLPTPVKGFADPAEIGKMLFNQYSLPFEITSVILLVAVVGAIVLTRVEKHRPESKELKADAVHQQADASGHQKAAGHQ